ncbi:MAG: hypothetical protein ACRCYU_13775 [Nocardioides sp.]
MHQTRGSSMRGYVQIDYAGWLRDVEMEGTVHIEEADGGGVYVFQTR